MAASRTTSGLLIIGPAGLHERWHPHGGLCLVANATAAGLEAIIAGHPNPAQPVPLGRTARALAEKEKP